MPKSDHRIKSLVVAAMMALLLGAGSGFVIAAELEKEYINPNASYTHVVSVTSNGVKTLYLSGQVALGDEGTPEEFGEQADLAFANLVSQLRAAGASPEDVVKLTTFIVDLDPEKMGLFGEARNKHLAVAPPPASTVIGVSALAREVFKIEIEAIAVVSAE